MADIQQAVECANTLTRIQASITAFKSTMNRRMRLGGGHATKQEIRELAEITREYVDTTRQAVTTLVEVLHEDIESRRNGSETGPKVSEPIQ